MSSREDRTAEPSAAETAYNGAVSKLDESAERIMAMIREITAPPVSDDPEERAVIPPSHFQRKVEVLGNRYKAAWKTRAGLAEDKVRQRRADIERLIEELALDTSIANDNLAKALELLDHNRPAAEVLAVLQAVAPEAAPTKVGKAVKKSG